MRANFAWVEFQSVGRRQLQRESGQTEELAPVKLPRITGWIFSHRSKRIWKARPARNPIYSRARRAGILPIRCVSGTVNATAFERVCE